jgi:hypothetical protein
VQLPDHGEVVVPGKAGGMGTKAPNRGPTACSEARARG